MIIRTVEIKKLYALNTLLTSSISRVSFGSIPLAHKYNLNKHNCKFSTRVPTRTSGEAVPQVPAKHSIKEERDQ